MAPRIGTYTTDDLKSLPGTISQNDPDAIAAALQRNLDTFNEMVAAERAELCADVFVEDEQAATAVTAEMEEVTEFGQVETQKDEAGYRVGYPLRMFSEATGWTRMYQELATPADLVVKQVAMQRGYARAIRREYRRAIFRPTNYTFKDRFASKKDLAVKAFLNADGIAIPEGPNAEVFDGTTHQHYLASATLTTTAANSLINTVVEHGYGDDLRIYINRADEATWTGLSGFKPALGPFDQYPNPAALGERLDPTRVDNRMIGVYGAAHVWTKPWVLANYSFAFSAGSPDKPLAFRQRAQAALRGLRIVSEKNDHPLFARWYQADFGAAVRTRANGAVLQFNNGTYQAPTIGM